eukprot:CAMPEP_0182598470 /NCGR_PEP_ID=MMETSP1324-20130603/88300_1 /TAXON_ID=236786 /ORGANISM="Florenciella sp., Strain RCC1587" /LENGTH=236 /DNA_ID=CAMNT_0024816303 /DNA_START=172 /DNA_END=882 /DNA_ORIENTATION=+
MKLLIALQLIVAVVATTTGTVQSSQAAGGAGGAEEMSSRMQVKYCNNANDPHLLDTQPARQLEQMTAFSLTRSTFAVDWHAAPEVCGRNITSYMVSVSTTSWPINRLMGMFGGFPQSTCSGSSKVNGQVKTQDGQVPNACSPYEDVCSERQRRSEVALPSILWVLVEYADIKFAIHAFGTTEPLADETSPSGYRAGYGAEEPTAADFFCIAIEKSANETKKGGGWRNPFGSRAPEL